MVKLKSKNLAYITFLVPISLSTYKARAARMSMMSISAVEPRLSIILEVSKRVIS